MCILPVGYYLGHAGQFAYGRFEEKREKCLFLRSIGRLDKDTSGAVLFAKTKLAAARLSEERERGRYEKEYLAVAEGYSAEETGEIHLPHQPGAGEQSDSDGSDSDRWEESRHTYWKVERQFQNCSSSPSSHHYRPDTPDPGASGGNRGIRCWGDPLYGENVRGIFAGGAACVEVDIASSG